MQVLTVGMTPNMEFCPSHTHLHIQIGVDLVGLDLIRVDLVGHIHYTFIPRLHIYTHKHTYTHTHTHTLSLQHSTSQRNRDLQQLMTWPWNLAGGVRMFVGVGLWVWYESVNGESLIN